MIVDLPRRYSPDGESVEGGFGSVFFCDDLNLKRKVAIKVINDRRDRRRINDEIQALLAMRSKHVVQVYDVVVSKNGDIGIVQEFIDGDDLFESSLPKTSLESYLKTLWQIAVGLADIHNAELIHRDIKPNNIKIDGEGILKIFDFGLARPEGPKARTIGFVGTPGFAAPELYSGGAFTKAVDTYAFGATALYIATDDLPKVMLAVPPARPAPNAFTDLPFKLHSEVEDILHRCISTNSLERPQMREVKAVLGKHLLINKHQALTIHNGHPSLLNAAAPEVSLELPRIGRVEIHYDGLTFSVAEVSGEVYINNRLAVKNDEIPGSCVVSLGSPMRRANERAFITFDVSNPEVVL